MKKITAIALAFFASSVLLASEGGIVEANSSDVLNKLDAQNEQILMNYTSANKDKEVESLPPFATMADVKVAVSKLIKTVNDNSNKFASSLEEIQQKDAIIKSLEEKLALTQADVNSVKEIVLSEETNTSTGKTTFTGLEKKVAALESKSHEPSIKQKTKHKTKIYAKAVFYPNAKVVNADYVNLRSAPYKCADIKGRLKNGQEVQLIKHSSRGWLKVKTSHNNSGWVSSEFVSKK